jgi:hypothetical protein
MNKLFNHRGYQLSCTAVRVSAGLFESALVAAKIDWPSRPRVLSIERAKHGTAEKAIEVAYIHGMKWVDEYG